MGISFDATNFDPAQTQDNMSLWVEMEVFSRLVRVNNVGTDIEGDLAESWDVSEDGTEYTFHLRPDAKFSDGSPVTADDVVFSIERAAGRRQPRLLDLRGDEERRGGRPADGEDHAERTRRAVRQ